MNSHKSKYQRNSKDKFSNSGFENTQARDLPFFTEVQIFFSGILTIIGLAFFGMGSLFMLVFGMSVSFDDWKFSDDDPISTKVEIKAINNTNASSNKIPVYQYVFSFETSEGKVYESNCYNTGLANFENMEIKVQYLQDNPQISRIEGMRKGEFSPFIMFFLIIFPLIGGILSFVGISKNLKYIKLVKYGKLTYGTFSHKETTGGKVNNQHVYRMFFVFNDETGTEYFATGDTHQTHRLEDEPKERLVYHPTFPNENIMIDSLPYSVRKFFDRQSDWMQA